MSLMRLLFKKENKECECRKRNGIIFHQEIQSLSKENQKIKEEIFKKNLEERVKKNLSKTIF